MSKITILMIVQPTPIRASVTQPTESKDNKDLEIIAWGMILYCNTALLSKFNLVHIQEKYLIIIRQTTRVNNAVGGFCIAENHKYSTA